MNCFDGRREPLAKDSLHYSAAVETDDHLPDDPGGRGHIQRRFRLDLCDCRPQPRAVPDDGRHRHVRVWALMDLGDMGMSAAIGFLQSFVGFILVLTVNYIARKTAPDSAIF